MGLVELPLTGPSSLLRLYRDDKIGADLFAEEEGRLSGAIREAQHEVEDAFAQEARSEDAAHSTSMLSLSQPSTSTRRGGLRERPSNASSTRRLD